MKLSTILFGVTGLLASTIQADIFTNQPFEKTTWNGGQTYNIVWKDGGKAPPLKEINNMSIQLMAGDENNQVPVALIAKNIKGTALKCPYTVPKTIGPPGDFYFIKYTAGTYTAFSGSFSIEGISGKIPNFSPNSTTSASASASSTTSSTDSNDSTSTPEPTNNPTSGSHVTPAPKASGSGGSVTRPSSSMAGLSLSIVLLVVSYFY